MMLSYSQARELVHASTQQGDTELLPLNLAHGRILAQEVLAPMDHPFFDQTAVDGYAFCFADLQAGSALRVVDSIRAGDAGERRLVTGECSRIFTGAPLPPGADTTVMQEHTRREGDTLYILDQGLRLGGNVRRAGEQIKAGELALAQGSLLKPAAIGFLASLGISDVAVYVLPRVKIIVTGDEFATDPQDFGRGKIFESNGQMLVAAFAAHGIDATFRTCKDELATLETMVAQESIECDVLILTGGVSVGDYDFSRAALESQAYEVVFHQVAQKPGKPLLFCKRGTQLAFGLPGNPRASLMCFYIYVLPALLQMQGAHDGGLRSMRLPLAHDFNYKQDHKTHFLTGRRTATGVSLLEGQQSHMLKSFAEADVIVVIESATAQVTAGTMVPCFWL